MKKTSEDFFKKLFFQNLSCYIQGAAYLREFTVFVDPVTVELYKLLHFPFFPTELN